MVFKIKMILKEKGALTKKDKYKSFYLEVLLEQKIAVVHPIREVFCSLE